MTFANATSPSLYIDRRFRKEHLVLTLTYLCGERYDEKLKGLVLRCEGKRENGTSETTSDAARQGRRAQLDNSAQYVNVLICPMKPSSVFCTVRNCNTPHPPCSACWTSPLSVTKCLAHEGLGHL